MALNRARTWRKVLLLAAGLAVGLAAFFAALGAPNALASTSGPAVVQPAGIVAVLPATPDNDPTFDQMGGTNQYDATCASTIVDCLPVFRWADATASFHTRLSSNPLDIVGSTSKVLASTNLRGTQMSWGNFAWSLTMYSIQSATTMDPLRAAGTQVDHMAARLGQALITSPLAALLVAAVVIMVLWNAYRRNEGIRAFRKLGITLLTVGAIVAMIAGATQSTGTGANYNPGVMSPGWVTQTMSTIINKSTDGITEALVDQGTIDGIAIDSPGTLDCADYTQVLRGEYQTKAGSNHGTTGAVIALNNLWEQTGMNSWITMQLDSGATAYRTYCHLLEWQAGVSPSAQANIQTKAGSSPAPTAGALAWGPATVPGNSDDDSSAQDDVADQAMIGWAVCQWQGDGWAAASGWNDVNGKSASDIAKDCQKWWGDPASSDGGDNTAFNIKAKQSNIAKALDQASPEARAFTSALHGESTPGGSIAPTLYLFSAVVSLIVFGLMGLIVVVTKVGLLIYAALLVVILFISLWPGKADDKMVAKFFKDLLGMTFISWGYSLILTFLVLITSLIMSLINGGVTSAKTFAAGPAITPASTSMLSMLVASVAPLAAVFLIGKLFTSILHMPNPLSVRGALAFGAMGGAVGGAGLGELWDRGKEMVKGGANRARNRAAGKNGNAGGPNAPQSDNAVGKGTGGMADAVEAADDSEATPKELAKAQKRLDKRAAERLAADEEAKKLRAEQDLQEQRENDEVRRAERAFAIGALGGPVKGRLVLGAMSVGDAARSLGKSVKGGAHSAWGAARSLPASASKAIRGDKLRQAAGIPLADWEQLSKGERKRIKGEQRSLKLKGTGTRLLGMGGGKWDEASTAERARAVGKAFAKGGVAAGAALATGGLAAPLLIGAAGSITTRAAKSGALSSFAKQAIGMGGGKWDEASAMERAKSIGKGAVKGGALAAATLATGGLAAPLLAGKLGKDMYGTHADRKAVEADQQAAELEKEHKAELMNEVQDLRAEKAAKKEARRQKDHAVAGDEDVLQGQSDGTAEQGEGAETADEVQGQSDERNIEEENDAADAALERARAVRDRYQDVKEHDPHAYERLKQLDAEDNADYDKDLTGMTEDEVAAFADAVERRADERQSIRDQYGPKPTRAEDGRPLLREETAPAPYVRWVDAPPEPILGLPMGTDATAGTLRHNGKPSLRSGDSVFGKSDRQTPKNGGDSDSGREGA